MSELNLLPEQAYADLKTFLDGWVERTETPSYIETDPVLFMHAYEEKTDRELAGFFAAIMAWGRRDIVISKVDDLLRRMDYRPADFIRNYEPSDQRHFRGFKHRTFKPVDIHWLVTILHRILRRFGSFEAFWKECYRKAITSGRELMGVFPEQFFALAPEAPRRTRKHISSADRNSACKRLYLYLRWAVRSGSPVDTGIMSFMPPSELKIPLDVHVARQARLLGLLDRKYNDWKATTALTAVLRRLDPGDPAKYDYALFGLGISEEQPPEKFLVNRQYAMGVN
ncbi:MAG: TIGR02757 family protein [Balneolaceae bacterium]|nr:TIGR02757 family protein [Balneolaceae bacterium]